MRHLMLAAALVVLTSPTPRDRGVPKPVGFSDDLSWALYYEGVWAVNNGRPAPEFWWAAGGKKWIYWQRHEVTETGEYVPQPVEKYCDDPACPECGGRVYKWPDGFVVPVKNGHPVK